MQFSKKFKIKKFWRHFLLPGIGLAAPLSIRLVCFLYFVGRGNKNKFCNFFSCCNSQIRHQLLRGARTRDCTNADQAFCRLHVGLLPRIAPRCRHRHRDLKRGGGRRWCVHIHSCHFASSCRWNPDLCGGVWGSATRKIKECFWHGTVDFCHPRILHTHVYWDLWWEKYTCQSLGRRSPISVVYIDGSSSGDYINGSLVVPQ